MKKRKQMMISFLRFSSIGMRSIHTRVRMCDTYDIHAESRGHENGVAVECCVFPSRQMNILNLLFKVVPQ